MRCLNCNSDGIPKHVTVCPICSVYLPSILKETLEPGTQLSHNSYSLDYAIATGGFGIIYQGFHKHLNRQVAIKEFYPHNIVLQRGEFGGAVKVPPDRHAAFENERQQFLYEGQLLAHLKHPGIVAAYDLFEEKNTVYIVMEMIKGQSLREEIKKAPNGLPSKRVEILLEELIPIIGYMHKQGVYHLDIKPDNIMITSEGKPILVDFGAATTRDKPRPIPQYDERYCAPEVPTGKDIGPQSDLFELGMTVYELLTGRLQPSMVERAMGREWSEVGLDAFWRQLLEPTLSVPQRHRPADVEIWWNERRDTRRKPVVKPEKYVPPDKPYRKARLSRRLVLEGAGKVALATSLAAIGAQAYTTLFASAAIGMNLEVYRGHAQSVYTVAWSPDNSKIASAGEAGTIQVWQVASANKQMAYTGHSKAVTTLAWAPNGLEVASGSMDGTVQIWKVETGVKLYKDANQHGPVQCVAWSPDGKQIASAGESAVMRIWSPQTGKTLTSMSENTNTIHSLAWSPDGKFLASVGNKHIVTIWSALTGKMSMALPTQKEGVETFAWSPDGQQLLTGDSKQMLRIWDISTGKQKRAWKAHEDAITVVAWSPDGQTLASGSKDKTVKIWNTNDGMLRLTYKQHTGPINCLDWSHDNRYIVSASEDKTIQVWETIH